MILLHVEISEISDIMDAGYTHVRVYTDTLSTGNFTTLDGTITLVAGQVKYSYVDTDGTSATWYKTAYYSATVGEGSKSDAMQGGVSDAYCTPDEIKGEVQIASTITTYDAVLLAMAERATQAIDSFCGRKDGFEADVAATARHFVGSGGPIQWIDECVEVTAVAVKDSASDDETSYTSWVIGAVGITTEADCFPATGDPEMPDYDRMPYNFLIIGPNGDYSIFTSGSFTGRGGFRPTSTVARGIPTVKVTARWGYATVVPADIKQACIIQVARWWKRGMSAYADTTASAEMGALLYRQTLDPDIQQILVNGRYVRRATGRR